MKIFIIYLLIINIVAVAATAHDKRAARLHRHRVSESTLLLLAALGGAPAMYLTMLIIRHKTRKPKFMLGIPLIFLAEAAVVLVFLHYGFKVI